MHRLRRVPALLSGAGSAAAVLVDLARRGSACSPAKSSINPMPTVAVTRLHLRSPRFLLPFFLHTHRSHRQATNAPGNLGMRVSKTNGLAFWTLTLWRDTAAMRSFVIASPHKETMQKLADWCDKAAFAHWDQESNELPAWNITTEKLRTMGHLATVLHPSDKHKAGEIVVS